MSKHDGLRYNEGKIRHSLLSPIALKHMSSVMTKGALKYEAHNWAKGMAWSTVLDSLKRHLHEFEIGNDIDPEDGELHISKVAVNATFLIHYAEAYLRGDDRFRPAYLKSAKIALDVDDVVADFQEAYRDRFGITRPILNWSFSSDVAENLKVLSQEKDFWLNLKPTRAAQNMNFEPVLYLSHRSFPVQWTEEWLMKNNLPIAEVIHVDNSAEKVNNLLNRDIDFYYDDKYSTFVECNNAGITTFLFSSSHNEKYDVGIRRKNDLRL